MKSEPGKSTPLPVFQSKYDGENKKAPNLVLRIFIAATLFGALGGMGWWWFFGSKPRLLQSIAVPAANASSAESWRAGENDVALLAGGKLTILNLKDRQQRWVAALPLRAEVDEELEESLAKRFLKLQRWADELTEKRGKLKGGPAVKAFNAEASKYAAELAVVRASAFKKTAPSKPVSAEVAAPKRPHALGEDRSDVDELKTVRREDETMLRARIAKRTTQISVLRASIAALGKPAGNAMKSQQLSEQTGKLKSLERAQKEDEDALVPKPVDVAPVASKPAVPAGAAPIVAQSPRPRFAVLGEFFWLAEGARLIGFDRVSGVVKRTIPMPGPVVAMMEGRDSVSFVARVGGSIRHAVSIGADGRTQTVYMPYVEEVQVADTLGATGDSATPGDYSDVFGGASLALASIQTVAKQNDVQQAAESSATSTVPIGESAEGINYRVSISRPFATNVRVWQGVFAGRVQCFSIADISLITGGKKLVVLDSNNVQLWEAVLTAPVLIGDRSQWEEAPAPPCFVAGGRLYFSDRAGLTAFNAVTGEVIWRLSSIGVRKVTMDAEGFLYVQSANFSIDSHSQLASLGVGEQPVVMKVNPANGVPVWSREKLTNVWVSGKDVYALGAKESSSAQENHGLPSGHLPGILKLSRGSGKQRWEWTQALAPTHVFPLGKTLAVFYWDGLQLISSTAL